MRKICQRRLIILNFDTLINNIIAILNLCSDFPVFHEFPDIPLNTYPLFAVAAIEETKADCSVSDSNGNYPVNIKVRVSLFASPDTSADKLFDICIKDIAGCIMRSNLNLKSLSVVRSAINKSLNLMESYTVFTVQGTASPKEMIDYD